MTRSVPEWRGATDDAAIPKAVKLRIWAREEGRCYLTGLKINALKDSYEFEHVIALANGGEHREGNIRLALTEAHKVKTKADAGVAAKIRRVTLKHRGQWPKPKRKIESRGFEPSRSRSF